MSEIFFDYCSRLNDRSAKCMEAISDLFEVLLEFEEIQKDQEVREFLDNPENQEVVKQLNAHRDSFRELLAKMQLRPERTDLT